MNFQTEELEVNILVALYNSNMTYLKNQLISLNNQTYNKIKIYFIDDCSNNSIEIQKMIKKYIINFEYFYKRNEKNLGCNKTFQKLIENSRSNYLAFCDQDDIWIEDKVEKYMEIFNQNKDVVLIYSDLEIIDEKNQKKEVKLSEIRKRIKHKEGKELWKYFLRMNTITGCSVIVRKDAIIKAIPIPDNLYIWDQWISIFASMEGEIKKYPIPKILYRIHSNNLVGANKLIGIENKQDYIEKRVKNEMKSLDLVFERVENIVIKNEILKQKKKCQNRLDYLIKFNLINLLKMISLIFNDFKLYFFEIILGLNFDKEDKLIKKIKKTNQ